jgi:hypothetical protein
MEGVCAGDIVEATLAVGEVVEVATIDDMLVGVSDDGAIGVSDSNGASVAVAGGESAVSVAIAGVASPCVAPWASSAGARTIKNRPATITN